MSPASSTAGSEQTSATPALGNKIVRSSFWSLLGNGAPMLVALFSIPIIAHTVGTARFGIISLSWVLVGYFGLFDLGLGRALTQAIATRIAAGRAEEIPGLFWTSLALLTAFGLLAMLILAGLSPLLTASVLNIPVELVDETRRALWVLSLTVPWVVLTTGLRGVLEAFQRFDYVAALRIPLGLLLYVGPLAVLPFSHSIVPIMFVFLVARVVAALAHTKLCLIVLPGLRRPVPVRRDLVRQLLGFGGWMTVSNIVSPLMVSMDRFLIASLLGVTAVAYYTAPYEVVTKLLLIPGSIAAVAFPAFSSAFVASKSETVRVHEVTSRVLTLVLVPISIVLLLFADEMLGIWMGHEFAKNGSLVLRIIAVGVVINGIAHVPFALVQAAGQPSLTAKVHLLELPLYAGFVVVLSRFWGISGTAAAWSLRVFLDYVCLFFLSGKLLNAPSIGRVELGWVLVSSAAALLPVVLFPSLGARCAAAAVLTAAHFVLGWRLLLNPSHRALVSGIFARVRLTLTIGFAWS